MNEKCKWKLTEIKSYDFTKEYFIYLSDCYTESNYLADEIKFLDYYFCPHCGKKIEEIKNERN